MTLAEQPTEADAFIRTVEAAIERLSRAEGRRVSVRSLVRRAGYPDDHPDAGRVRARFFYHLNRRRPWPEGHQVPVDLVNQFAQVLPVDADVLMRAAQQAAGFDVEVPDGPDHHIRALATFLGEDGVPAEEKLRVLADLNELIASEIGRLLATLDTAEGDGRPQRRPGRVRLAADAG